MILIWFNISRIRRRLVVFKTLKAIAISWVPLPIRIMSQWCHCLIARLPGVLTSWTIMTRTSLSLQMINRLITVAMSKSILPLLLAILFRIRDGKTTSQQMHLSAFLLKLCQRLVLFNLHRPVQGLSKPSLRSHHLLTGPSLRCLARN